MEFGPTPVNWMVLAAMGACVAAALALGAGALVGMVRAGGKTGRTIRTAGWALFGAGFAVALAAWIVRWCEVRHAPLQNLYEVCLTMGVLLLPISLFCRMALRVGAEWADAVLAAVVLFPVVFVFSGAPQRLPAALQSALFIPHVAAYLVAYLVLAKATVQAAWQLITAADGAADASAAAERSAYRMVALGFPLLTLGLVLGAVWGKLAWGDWWNWDPKELWSLVSWLVFLAYLHLRAVCGPRWARVAAALVCLGMVCILITLWWVNLSSRFEGLHSYA